MLSPSFKSPTMVAEPYFLQRDLSALTRLFVAAASQPRDCPPPEPRLTRLAAEPLLAARQPSAPAGLQHAAGVRMASSRGVPLRGDQHVFGQRRQLLAAQRTPVCGGLSVLRSADRPPAGRDGLGHDQPG